MQCSKACVDSRDASSTETTSPIGAHYPSALQPTLWTRRAPTSKPHSPQRTLFHHTRLAVPGARARRAAGFVQRPHSIFAA